MKVEEQFGNPYDGLDSSTCKVIDKSIDTELVKLLYEFKDNYCILNVSENGEWLVQMKLLNCLSLKTMYITIARGEDIVAVLKEAKLKEWGQ